MKSDEARLEKIERINEEIKRLSKGFTKIPAKAKTTVKKLIENAAFMAITLEDLQNQINETGTVEEYQNGANQWGTKTNPDVQTYNSMIKNYSNVIKQLSEFLPKEDPKPKEKEDQIEAFINSR